MGERREERDKTPPQRNLPDAFCHLCFNLGVILLKGCRHSDQGAHMPSSALRRRHPRLVILCALCAIACTRSPLARASATAAPADLSTYVAASMKAFSIPGLALAVVKDGNCRG